MVKKKVLTSDQFISTINSDDNCSVGLQLDNVEKTKKLSFGITKINSGN